MASSSSSRKRKYEVFLSFSGIDTRQSFLSHLRRRLDDENIIAFKDDEMKRGKEIAPALVEGIESSKIAVVILSKHYASSRWCLDELVKILECQEKNGLLVLPIFLNVDPSDARKPRNGTFAVDFARHEKNFNNEQVTTWVAAMTEVANLSGYPLGNVSESELVDKIRDVILQNLEPIPFIDQNKYVGIESHIRKLKSLMDGDTQRIIGIAGMGGVGKTTIARVIFHRIRSDFESRIFLCVADVLRDSGLIGLANTFLSELLGKEVRISSRFVSDSCYARWLCHKKILVILDDVNNSEQFENLIGENGSFVFGPGSRIIVTSRDKQLLRTICSNGDNSIYEVRGLYDSDALKLFCRHAFKKNDPLEEFRNMLEPFLRYADGNPLALKVLGSSLFRKPKSVWEDVLNGLSKCQKKGIHNVLRISFDGLDKMEKKIFLDIACLLYGDKKSTLISLLDSQARSGLDVLRDKCLLDWDNECEDVVMHSLLMEMAREIVGEESDNPGKRSRLWDYSDIYQVFNKNSGTEAIEGINLNYNAWDEEEKDVYLKSDAFKKMPNLKFLIFRYPHRVHCPLGLEYLPDELRLLEWSWCPLKRLPINFQPTNLVELDLGGARELEQLWEGIQDLRKLKRITLKNCSSLIKLPDLSSALNLVEVDLTYCSSLVEIPSSMNHLNKLKDLNLQGCRTIRSLPSPIAWRSLERLDLDECSKLTSFPEIECLDALKRLDISHCDTLESLPSSIWKLKCLEQLDLEGCSNLENLSTSTESPESSRSQFSPLRFLNVSHCKSLETLFELEQLCGFPNFENPINSMFFYNCRKLDVQWSKIAALAKMKIQAEAVYSYFQGEDYLFNMVYPGCEIPKWIKYQNMGHSITIQLPVNRRFLGFALCAVVPACDSFDFKFELCFKNTSGDSFSWMALQNLDLSLGSEHVILCFSDFGIYQYNEMVEKLGRRGYDVAFNIERANVLKCGLVPLYAQNVNYKGLETPLNESETTEVAINLTKDELEVFVDKWKLKYPNRKTVLETYKDASTEILEVDPLTLSAFCGTLHFVWGNERCKEFAVGTLCSPNEKCSICTDEDESTDEDENEGTDEDEPQISKSNQIQHRHSINNYR